MERIRRGFRLLGASWEVLKSDRELLWLPVVSFVLILLVSLSVMGIAWGAGTFQDTAAGEGVRTGPLEYVLLGILYFLTYFVAIFFNAAVVAAATIRLQGGDPTVSDGLRVARQHVGKIAGWAAVSATVGLILRAIEERAGFLGDIIVRIVGAAWAAVTFFVVPVLIYEPLGVGASIKRSASIFKARWGEQFTGNVAIGLAIFLISIPVFLVLGGLASAVPVVGVPLLVVAVALIAAVGAAMSGIFNAALYRFATTGEAGGAFSPTDLEASFKPKGRR